MRLEQQKPGATIIPIIISTDKTQVTLFRSKSAYPVYLTIGNIPKEIRRKPSKRAQILLAYLPTTKLEHIPNKAARRRALANLFHSCMARILAPLETAAIDGMIMASGDGVKRRVHPIVASYAADYPEQTLVTCIKAGECPICDTPHDELGRNDTELRLRNLDQILAVLLSVDRDPARFMCRCRKARIKPIPHPFWMRHLFLNIFMSITPDVLHQILQGVLKHVITWIKMTVSSTELDLRCQCLPPNHNIRLFVNGISGLSKVTGKEHDEMARIFLGILLEIPLPYDQNGNRLIRAVRALLDFYYLSTYPEHTSETLASLDDALDRFHRNKDIFVDLGVRNSFNIPKLHFLRHYSMLIKYFGTTDNYNTQTTERLHIDYAKDAYRATNSKDEYPQMTIWMERKEKVLRHASYISWRLAGNENIPAIPPNSMLASDRYIWLPKKPSVSSVALDVLVNAYGAVFMREALARYVITTNHPDWSRHQVECAALDVFLPFRNLPVFHRMKFIRIVHGKSEVVDSIHARPACQKTHRGNRFDTGLINLEGGTKTGMQGMCVLWNEYHSLMFCFRSPCCPSPSHLQNPRRSHQATFLSALPAAPNSCLCRVVFTIFSKSRAQPPHV